MDNATEAFASLPQPFAHVEARSHGLSPNDIRMALRRDVIMRLATQVYAVRTPWLARSRWARHQDMAAAASRLTPDAIVSHASGAVRLGLPHPAYPPQKIAMTLLDDGRTSRSDTWRRFHRGRTPAQHIVIRSGVPEFVVPRVVIDSGREVPPRDCLAIGDGALRLDLTSRDELLDMRRHQRRWPGVASTNEPLMLVDGRRENWLESASVLAMARWAMPIPVPQVNVFTPDGEFVGRPDCLWPGLGVVGEADGTQKYLLAGATEEAVLSALRDEKVRQSGMTSLGLAFVRWNMHEAIDGDAIETRFTRAADPIRARRVTAIFRCSCCGFPLEDCAVEAELVRWRRLLTKEFERTVW